MTVIKFGEQLHLYINTNRGFFLFNFEQARHFCSKQDVQKQWSLAYVNFIKYFFLFSQPKGQRPLFEYLSFKPVKNPVITKLIFYLHEKGHEFGFNQNHGLRTPNEGINQRNLKFWANVADKICFGRAYKFEIGIWYSAVQWRRFPHRVSVVRASVDADSQKMLKTLCSICWQQSNTWFNNCNL